MENSVQRRDRRARKWSILSLSAVICPLVVAATLALSTVSNAMRAGQRDNPSSPNPRDLLSWARSPIPADASVGRLRPPPFRHPWPDAGLPPPGLDAGDLEPLDSEELAPRPSASAH